MKIPFGKMYIGRIKGIYFGRTFTRDGNMYMSVFRSGREYKILCPFDKKTISLRNKSNEVYMFNNEYSTNIINIVARLMSDIDVFVSMIGGGFPIVELRCGTIIISNPNTVFGSPRIEYGFGSIYKLNKNGSYARDINLEEIEIIIDAIQLICDITGYDIIQADVESFSDCK